ncbi:MAG: putative secretion system protein GspF-like [Gemmataceae bacterium]|nr:putative secretion system protein GspF-like [Gemmataceae bacterium]
MRVRAALPTLGVFAQIIGGVILFVLLEWVSIPVGIAGPGSLLFFVINGWALYAFFRYREGRQDELYQVLLAAVEREVPLAPALRSYLRDQPRLRPARGVRLAARAGIGLIYMLFLPLYVYCRLWIGWRSFDRYVADLADQLEAGESLSGALMAVPGVACREVRLAAEVGEATGALGACLAGANRERWSAAWLEVAPRLLYPFLVLLFVSAITTFLMIAIVPKFKRIFAEFGEHLPVTTTVLIDAWTAAEEFLPLVPVAALLGVAAVSVVGVNAGVRWYTPLIGRLYRWGVQGEILRTLGRLLAAGQTVPQALGFLARSDVLPGVVRRRLNRASGAVEGGEPLNDALARAGLLPEPMSPLVRTSERVGTLPWALVELGDHLAGRAFRVVRRLSLVVAPVLVVVVGSLVGFIALGMFLPLIQLLTRLSE